MWYKKLSHFLLMAWCSPLQRGRMTEYFVYFYNSDIYVHINSGYALFFFCIESLRGPVSLALKTLCNCLHLTAYIDTRSVHLRKLSHKLYHTNLSFCFLFILFMSKIWTSIISTIYCSLISCVYSILFFLRIICQLHHVNIVVTL